MADFYAARAGTNAGAPLDGFLTAVHSYRKIAALLRSTAGWVVNDKRVERIWRREGLKVPARQSGRVDPRTAAG